MQTFNEINQRLPEPLKLKRTKTKVCTYRKGDSPLKIFGELYTVNETKTKFLESTFFLFETKNMNLLPDVPSLSPALIKTQS